MYIPEIHHFPHVSSSGPLIEAPTSGIGQQHALITSPVLPVSTAYHNNEPNIIASFFHLFTWATNQISHILSNYTLPSSTPSSQNKPLLSKRGGGSSVSTTIGVVVGILLTVFVIGIGGFLYVYHKSIRVRYRRRRRRSHHSHHHHKTGSKSSKSSATSAPPDAGGDEGGGGGEEEAPADPGGGEEGGEG
ncbi:hypothetical protein F5Y16DRAFT_154542 [Xylariaceae sp. FL0255]|nr:hypothetical protein F5Y16DRAFT_154542 [Xylariaceae sp. FL0255]